MNYFIVGGAGFIGSHLANKIIKEEKDSFVTVFDNFTSGKIWHLDEIKNRNNVKIVEGDVKEIEKLSDAIKNHDIVYHFASNPDIAKAVTQPDIDFWEGTYLTQNILEAMRVNSVPEILYTSGSGIYGEAPDVAFQESYGPCFPISTYGASKMACEALISSYCHMFSMRGRAFRFANVVGPKQTHGVGYDFIRRLKQNPSQLRILGDGSQSKAYIHVEDVIDAMLLVHGKATENQGQCFDVFNVATDDYISVTEIADIACRLAGLKPGSVDYQYTGGDRGWKGDVPKVLFNVAKIKKLGWRAKRTSAQAIEASIAAMYNEIQENLT